MKFTKGKFRIFQISSLVIVTSVTLYFGLYFPNVPPLIRGFVVKHRVSLQNEPSKKSVSVDKNFLQWFNRDPDRQIPSEPRIVVSPADGFIAGIGTKNDAHHILIEMRYTDVHVQRVPLDGRVIEIEGEGRELPPGYRIMDYTLDKLFPFQKWTVFETEIGRVVVRQITSLFAKRIEVFLKEGQFAKRGERLGRVLAGSNVVLELPVRTRLTVEKGQEVVGGETIVARY